MKKKIIFSTIIFMLIVFIYSISRITLADELNKEIGENDNWQCSFELPKYDDEGKLILYEIDEANVPEGYTKNIEGETITNKINQYNYKVEYYYDGKKDETKTEIKSVDYGTVINEYTNKIKTGYILEKAEGLGLKVGINEDTNIIKIFYKTETVIYSGTKTWKDDNNQQGLRPSKYTLKLYANDELLKEQEFENETWEFTDLQKYDYETGEEIIYTVKEDEIILENGDKYVPTINGNEVINTLTGTTIIEAKKIWEDNENINKTRPDNIVVIIKKILSE